MTSLFSNRKSSLPPSAPSSLPPKPKPFDMTEPFLERGVWCFWLTAEDQVLNFVSHLHCVLQQPQTRPFFIRRPQARMLFSINPRYDHQEAWLWIYELLECETREVELSEIWVNALNSESENESQGEDFFD